MSLREKAMLYKLLEKYDKEISVTLEQESEENYFGYADFIKVVQKGVHDVSFQVKDDIDRYFDWASFDEIATLLIGAKEC
ncbi:MAG: hypothetical protein RR540_00945 [Oscillospiraceae bacterium]